MAPVRFRALCFSFLLAATGSSGCESTPASPSAPPGSSIIDIYVNKDHEKGTNWAYWGGFIVTIRSSNLTGHCHDYAVYPIRHELTHLFELLIEGRGSRSTPIFPPLRIGRDPYP